MPKEIKIYSKPQQIEKKSLSISEIFQIIYFWSLLVGIMLSFFYYYHIGFWPSLSNTSAISYLIGIFSVGVLISLIIFILFCLPSFALFMDIQNPTIKISFPYLISFAWSIWIIFFSFAIYPEYFILILFITIFILTFLLVQMSVPKSYLYDKLKFNPSIFVNLFVLLPQAILLPLLSFRNDTGSRNTLYFMIFSTALLSILVNFYLIKKFTSKIPIKEQFLHSLYVLIFTSIGFSIIAISTDSKNLLVIKPFELLHFGDYDAKLQFSTDFNTSILYQSSGKEFKILSSVGDEYIVKNDNNSSNVYRINKKYILQETIVDSNLSKTSEQ